MIISDDAICSVCGRVFCCSKCRQRHEEKEHPDLPHDDLDDNHAPLIPFLCPICEQKPLPLQAEMNEGLVQHIKQNHLPLNCQKCSKLYNKMEDLQEFSKCIQTIAVVDSETDQMKSAQTRGEIEYLNRFVTTVATQTSPLCTEEATDGFSHHITSNSMPNIRWLATRSKLTATANDELHSESVSSIKSISSIHNSTSRKSIGLSTTAVSNGVKLVRSTSTPLPLEIATHPKPKEQTYLNISCGHVSSIHSSSNEPEVSQPIAVMTTPSKYQLENVHRYRQICSRKKKPALTPLRHVMSKSIQKAIAEHVNARAVQRRIFDTTDSGDDNQQLANSGNSPIDLRLSPAIRRTQNEVIKARTGQIKFMGMLPPPRPPPSVTNTDLQNEYLLSSKQTTTTESIVITRMEQMSSINAVRLHANNNNSESNTNCVVVSEANACKRNSVYHTRRSIEIVTELSEIRRRSQTFSPESKTSSFKSCIDDDLPSNDFSMLPQTPIAGIPAGSGGGGATFALVNKKFFNFESETAAIQTENTDEKFFTPHTTPVKESSCQVRRIQSDSKLVKEIMTAKSYTPSPLRRPSIRQAKRRQPATPTTENFQIRNENVSGRLWSLVTSVIRLPSFSGNGGNGDNAMVIKQTTAGEKMLKSKNIGDNSSMSTIRRCSSASGTLTLPKPISTIGAVTLKRKRTNTNDNQTLYLSTLNNSESLSSSISPKRLRIHGRKPIGRLRPKP